MIGINNEEVPTMGHEFAMVVLGITGIMGIAIIGNIIFWTWFDKQ
jgi:hypothetical protein